MKNGLNNNSIFVEVLGNNPIIRVLDFLIDNQFFDYPITEIAKGSNVSYNSIKIFFPNFIKSGIIYKTRKIGKSDYYKLNIKNPIVENLIKLDWIMTKRNILSQEEIPA